MGWKEKKRDFKNLQNNTTNNFSTGVHATTPKIPERQASTFEEFYSSNLNMDNKGLQNSPPPFMDLPSNFSSKSNPQINQNSNFGSTPPIQTNNFPQNPSRPKGVIEKDWKKLFLIAGTTFLIVATIVFGLIGFVIKEDGTFLNDIICGDTTIDPGALVVNQAPQSVNVSCDCPSVNLENFTLANQKLSALNWTLFGLTNKIESLNCS